MTKKQALKSRLTELSSGYQLTKRLYDNTDSTTMLNDDVFIHPDINTFMLLNGTEFSLFKHPNGRLAVRMLDSLDDYRMDDNMLEREALRLRDSLIKMYPPRGR